MARLHEHEGKALLADRGVAIPRGRVASSADEAGAIAKEIGGFVVLKIQAWTTGRKALGGVAFADSPDEAREHAERLLKMRVGAFPVERVLVEEQVPIAHELFVSQSIDDRARAPVMLAAFGGGSGIEDRAESVERIPVDVDDGVDERALRRLLADSPVEGAVHDAVVEAIQAAARTAREVEARSLEVNPLAVTGDGRVVAADCRVTIDDYAVFRHDDLGIEIARELDHPPTDLEKIAYAIEQADHRGTFYFAVLPRTGAPDERVIGFHGAGGGGSMMSMDAVSQAGFTPANFTDTSGNPSPAKVYAAARIILSQPGLVGYFGSGSGVASQEQFWSAYGLAKAFNEVDLDIPALVRLGGNSEARAIEILQEACAGPRAVVEGYGKDDPPRMIADRFRELVDAACGKTWTPRDRSVPGFVGGGSAASYTVTFGRDWAGKAWIDLDRCTPEVTAMLVKVSAGILKAEGDKPVLAVEPAVAATKDSEWIAMEVEMIRAGHRVVFVDVPIDGLEDVIERASKGEAA